ncbi:Copia protein [Vitis vinifera]|uniref:Copia protein n=1 Tax=Vitis vinifera TaxID=29760 RepID=A0A438IW68_VITVI|nr:Copia protein [Vitis vinifera]
MEFSKFQAIATSNPGITLQLSVIKPLQEIILRNDERSFYEKWEHSNRSCLMVMKYTMDKSIKELKLTYNALKEEWTWRREQYEEKTSTQESGGSKQFKRRGNLSQGAPSGSASSIGTKNEKFKWKCNFCHKSQFASWSFGDSSSVNSVVGCKHARMNLSSSMLWHKCLDFETCVVCLKGKMIAKTKMRRLIGVEGTLDLIHTDICGPLTPTALGGYKYFITFIDDFSRYGYVELIHEKSDSLNVFKAFKAKVEFSWESPLKLVKSDRGGEYYGRYDETGRNHGPFAKFLLECGIDARYTMSALLNRMGLQKGGITHCWICKFVPKTPYELWSGKNRVSSFPCLGCKVRFYCSSHTTRIIESDRVVYFEDEVNVDPILCLVKPFGEEHVVIPFPTSHVPNVDVPIVQQPATNQESMVIKWNLAFLLMILLLMGFL